MPAGANEFSFAEIAALGTSLNKRNIFYTTQGLMNTSAGSATNIIRGWINIPKSKQRFANRDKLVLAISAAASIDIDHCGFATYKEYS